MMKLDDVLAKRLEALGRENRLKGDESVICGVIPAGDGKGPRYLLEGEGETTFLRMNSNSYLGMSFRPGVVAAEDEAARSFGTGPGAVRFISGTWSPHVRLERRLAAFHGREAAMLFSSAYATVMGTLPPLISDKTAVISDELNHNCIINAIALARPGEKHIYRHPGHGRTRAPPRTGRQGERLRHHRHRRYFQHARRSRPARSDHGIGARRRRFPENVAVVVDDLPSARWAHRRGTEEYTSRRPISCRHARKGIRRQWRYVVAGHTIIRHLRRPRRFISIRIPSRRRRPPPPARPSTRSG
jgi:glycine C-acetyltransferase